jgi:hypothetical protein
MEIEGSVRSESLDDSKTISSWLLMVLIVVQCAPKLLNFLSDVATAHREEGSVRFLAFISINAYLFGSLFVLFVPAIWCRGTAAKATLRNVLSRPGTPLVFLALLPEIALIFQGIVYHHGFTRATLVAIFSDRCGKVFIRSGERGTG